MLLSIEVVDSTGPKFACVVHGLQTFFEVYIYYLINRIEALPYIYELS